MPVQKLHIAEFLDLALLHPVLDVRSPGEYNHAHIPGAISFPLFSDDQRRVVGTTYKQQSRAQAIKVGLDFFGPRMRAMVEEVEALFTERAKHPTVGNGASSPNTVLIHCWRGGMRSAGVAWLLDLYGFRVYTLTGGYKTYRNYVLQSIRNTTAFKILGGYTGSGKTYILHELRKKGQKVVDLEALACHKGSTFGAIGQPPQPSQEMFENLLAHEFLQLTNIASKELSDDAIWLEDESQRIGAINLPPDLWHKMRQAPVYFIDIPFEERLQHVVDCYGSFEKEKMVNAIIRIRKRLGGLETKTAINFLLEDNTRECFRVLLKYYDKYYIKALNNRKEVEKIITNIPCNKVDAVRNAEIIINHQTLQGFEKLER